MESTHLLKSDLFDQLPSFNDLKNDFSIPEETIIVLDDDPTGTQTVNKVPVLTTWTQEAIQFELHQKTPLFYILTNSRSLTESQTVLLHQEIAENIIIASKQTSRCFQVISRSDSTLRGHFPSEPNILGTKFYGKDFMTILIPAFFEGGRYTLNNIHYVEDHGIMIPAAKTPFAQDATFGYQHSNLYDWVMEKSPATKKSEIFDLSINEIRGLNSAELSNKIIQNKDKKVMIINACEYHDLENFYKALLMAKDKSSIKTVFRTAASIPVMGKVKRRQLLSGSEIAQGKNGGLIVIGSYVPKTSLQLSVLLKETGIHSFEISVPGLLKKDARNQEINRILTQVNDRISIGEHVVIYTTRELKTGKNKNENLEINNAVSSGIVSIIRGITNQPSFIVAKGGITSSDVATKGLNIMKAMIMGQVLPGIPVWKSDQECKFPGLSYVVFPGNVGDDAALKTLFEKLRYKTD